MVEIPPIRIRLMPIQFQSINGGRVLYIENEFHLNLCPICTPNMHLQPPYFFLSMPSAWRIDDAQAAKTTRKCREIMNISVWERTNGSLLRSAIFYYRKKIKEISKSFDVLLSNVQCSCGFINYNHNIILYSITACLSYHLWQVTIFLNAQTVHFDGRFFSFIIYLIIYRLVAVSSSFLRISMDHH